VCSAFFPTGSILDTSLDFDKDTIHRFAPQNEALLQKVIDALVRAGTHEGMSIPDDWYKKIGIYFAFYHRSREKAVHYLNKYSALFVTEESQKTKEYAEACYLMGYAQLLRGDFKTPDLFNRALVIYKKFPVDLDVQKYQAFCLRCLAYVSHRLRFEEGREEESKQKLSMGAEELIRQVLSIQEMLPNVLPTDLGASYHALGAILLGSEKYDEAEEAFTKARTLWQEDYATHQLRHPDEFVTMQSLSMLLLKRDRAEEALKVLQQAYLAQVEFYKVKEHIDVAKTLHFMGEAQLKLGHFQLAYNTFHQALRIKLSLHESGSPIVMSTKQAIDALLNAHPEIIVIPDVVPAPVTLKA
jgi:tetratricopeptide (TPR) repeat protein